MTIIFLDTNNDNLYICSENEKMQKIDLGSPNLLELVPDDDILYVQDGVYLTKKQFKDWLDGGANFAPKPTPSCQVTSVPTQKFAQNTQQTSDTLPYDPHRLYIKPAHNGNLFIPDIHTPKYPDGLKMNGKWDWVPIDDIGGIDVINSNRFIKNMLEKKRAQIVNESFVQKHKNKATPYVSPAQNSINSIIIDEPNKLHKGKKLLPGANNFFDDDYEEFEGEYGPTIQVK